MCWLETWRTCCGCTLTPPLAEPCAGYMRLNYTFGLLPFSAHTADSYPDTVTWSQPYLPAHTENPCACYRMGTFHSMPPAGCCAWIHFPRAGSASIKLPFIRRCFSGVHHLIVASSPVVGLLRQRRKLAPSWACQRCRQNRRSAQSRRAHCQSWRASRPSPLRFPVLLLPVCQILCHMPMPCHATPHLTGYI